MKINHASHSKLILKFPFLIYRVIILKLKKNLNMNFFLQRPLQKLLSLKTTIILAITIQTLMLISLLKKKNLQ
ncbi:hypothetical protein TRFO_06509 [Tritrichomonas foetus]|uniref:Uncharacterized protein n=1 Tax=Tritrichomonas foetus TaxID=1144522 RepID=A0A1J4JYD3_9EUKA|nr:hypothetical protein TRFO_06509 [Tritrichomonas foetus]|eukprot:OHT03706.1 hypothetical protein TRFO_06509 [Tritrichomonas foetus]